MLFSRLFIASAALMMMGCASLMPQPRVSACNWQLPPDKMLPCPPSLPSLKQGATMGDLLGAAVAASESYHACRRDHDTLIAAVKIHAEICKP